MTGSNTRTSKYKFRQRLLVLLLSFVMIATYMPTMAFANDVPVPEQTKQTEQEANQNAEDVVNAPEEGKTDNQEPLLEQLATLLGNPLGATPPTEGDVAQIGEGESAVGYDTLAAAINAVQASQETATTITMIGNIVENVTVPANKKIVLDLNGKTIDGNAAGSVINVAKNGELTVKDSSATNGQGTNGTGKITNGSVNAGGGVNVNGKFTFESGSITANKATGNSSYSGAGILVTDGGNFIMTGGVVSYNEGSKHAAGIALSDSGTIGVISGGLIHHNKTTGDGTYKGGGIGVLNGAKLTIEGGTISDNESTDHGGGIAITGGTSALTITGGVIENNKAAKHGGGISAEAGQTTISGNAVIRNNTATWSGGNIAVSSSGALTITGGTIGKGTAGYDAGHSNSVYVHYKNRKAFNISGNPVFEDTILMELSTDAEGSASFTGGQFQKGIYNYQRTGFISGGIFTNAAKEATNTNLIETGKQFVANTDETTKDAYPWMIGVPPEAKIVRTDEQFTTLKEAIEKAESGDTIQLLHDVKVEGNQGTGAWLGIGKSLTIDGSKAEGGKYSITTQANHLFTLSTSDANLKFTVKNCVINQNDPVDGGYVVYSMGNAQIAIDNCEINSAKKLYNIINRGTSDGHANDKEGNIFFTNNVVNATATSFMPGLNAGGKIIGNVFNNIGEARAASIVAQATPGESGPEAIVITGNTFKNCTKNGLFAVNNVTPVTKIQIKDNTYESINTILKVETNTTLTSDSELINPSGKAVTVDAGKLTITGGNYLGKDSAYEKSGTGTLEISGGHFSTKPSVDDIVAGKCAISDTEEMKAAGYNYTIGEAVASITKDDPEVTTYYATLADAVVAAEANDTVTLLKNVTITEQLNIDKAITLDGGNYIVTRTPGGVAPSYKAGVLVTDAATIENLTIVGPNNAIGWDSGEFGIKLYNANGATLNNVTVTAANAGIQVNGGSVTMTGTINVSGNEFGGIELCHNGALDLSSATLKNDGETEATPVLWNDDIKGTITQNTEQKLWSKAVGIEKDHYYLSVARINNVYYQTLKGAVNAAQDGDTVVLLKDLYDSTYLYSYEALAKNKEITLDMNGCSIEGYYSYGVIVLDSANVIITDSTKSYNSIIKNKYTTTPVNAIFMQNENNNLALTNVKLESYGNAIQLQTTASKSSVTVGVGATVNSTYYRGIYCTGPESTITVDGGIVKANDYQGIYLKGQKDKVEVKSGTVQGDGYQGIFGGANNCTIIITGGKVTSNNGTAAIWNQGDDSTVTVTGGEVITTKYGIVNIAKATVNVENGMVSGDEFSVISQANNSFVNVSGGTVKSKSTAIYVNGDSNTLSITGGTVESEDTAIQVNKSGNTVNIKNGTVKGKETGIYSGNDTESAANKITVDGGNVTADDYGIVLFDYGQLDMKSGNVTTTKGHAICNNGSETKNSIVNISGGTITAGPNGEGFYHAGPGTLNISGGTISGLTGVEMRAGTINVSGGTLIATAEEYECDANANGPTTQGAALAIAQHVTKIDITANITGGTFKGIVPVNECNPQENDPAPRVDFKVSDGEFWSTAPSNQKVFNCVDCKEFITGGFFTHVPDAKYIAPEKSVRDTTTEEKEEHGDQYLYTIGDATAKIIASDGTTVKGYYYTLSEAVDVASEGETVVLLGDITINKQINVDKEITLDGNNKTITRTPNTGDAGTRAGILVSAGATIKNLTVSGPNTQASGWDSGEFGIKLYNANSATLNNVTVTAANAGIQVNGGSVAMTGTIDVSGNEFGGIELCHNGVLDLSSATLKNDGETEATPVLWNDDNKGKITQNSAQTLFVKKVNESKDHYYLYCAKNKETEKLYTSLQDAFDEVLTGQTVILLTDIELKSPARLDKAGTFTIDGNGKTISAATDANFGADGCLCFGPGGGWNADEIAQKNFTIKNTTLSGFNTGVNDVIRAEGCTLTIDKCAFNGNTVNGARSKAVVLLTGVDAKILNSTFEGNTAGLCIDFNTQGGAANPNNDSNIKVDNCYFKGNVLTGNGVVYLYGPKGSVTNNTFEANSITADGVAVIYLSGKADRIANNLFKANTVKAGGTGKLGVIAFGSSSAGTALEENAFVGNTLNKNGKDVKSGTAYVGADNISLERNYWGDGAAPEKDDTKDIYEGKSVTVDQYATAYSLKANSYGVNVALAMKIAKYGDKVYTSYDAAKHAAEDNKFGEGWYFNTNPKNEDLALNCIVVKSYDKDWLYKVIAKAVDPTIKTDIEPGEQPAKAPTGELPEIVVAQEAAEVINIVDKTLGGVKDLQPDASSKLNDNKVINKDTEDEAKAEFAKKEITYDPEKDTMMLVIEPYFNTRTESGTKEAEKITSIKYQIDAKYNVLATTAETAEQMVKDGPGQNTVVIKTDQALTVTKIVTLSIPIPSNFDADDGDKVIVKHTHGDKIYLYEGTVMEKGEQKFVTFANPDGFSEFEIMTKSTPLTGAKIVRTDGTLFYDTLAKAVADVANGETIVLLSNASGEITVSREVAFTIDNAGHTNGATIKAGNGYAVTKTATETGYKYTVAKTYKVTFDANGGSGSMESKAVEKGTEFTLPENGFTAPSGKEFKAWLVNGEEHAPGHEIIVEADTVVKAVWKDAPVNPVTPSDASTGDSNGIVNYTLIGLMALMGIALALTLKKRFNR